jgi:hypothetical protein
VKKIYYYYLLIPVLLFNQCLFSNSVNANPRTNIDPANKIDKFVYTPVQLPLSGEVKDILSHRDIPTGDGGFARDYAIKLMAGDQIVIDLTSESFDTVVMLLNAEGKTISKNDDAADGTSNSLLFTRIKDAGTYVVRIQGFGETSSGEFKLKISKLKQQ